MKTKVFAIFIILVLLITPIAVDAAQKGTTKSDEKANFIGLIKTKQLQVKENRQNTINLKKQITAKNKEIRNLVSTLKKEKKTMSQKDIDNIKSILEKAKSDMKITKNSVDDVKITFDKLKFNILNKNYAVASNLMDEIINIQKNRINSLNSVLDDLDKLEEVLKGI